MIIMSKVSKFFSILFGTFLLLTTVFTVLYSKETGTFETIFFVPHIRLVENSYIYSFDDVLHFICPIIFLASVLFNKKFGILLSSVELCIAELVRTVLVAIRLVRFEIIRSLMTELLILNLLSTVLYVGLFVIVLLRIKDKVTTKVAITTIIALMLVTQILICIFQPGLQNMSVRLYYVFSYLMYAFI